MFVPTIQRSERNTPATKIRLGGVHLYFSYDTIVAASVSNFDCCVRENVWGPTTGRHLREWGFRKEYCTATEEQLEAYVKEKLVEQFQDTLREKFL